MKAVIVHEAALPRSTTSPWPGRPRNNLFCSLLLLSILFALHCPQLSAQENESTSPPERNQDEPGQIRQRLGSAWSEYADALASYNPKGAEVSGGLEYRNSYRYDNRYDSVSSYWQTGVGMNLTPAYAQPSVHLEWMPFLAVVGRLQYDRYYYFGANGGLLSFSSAGDPYGDRELGARRGTEESGVGSRVLFQPTVQLKTGDIVMRNQSDIARYRFPGKGPFFLVQEYDALLENGGSLLANRTQVLKEIKGPDADLLVGPYYEIVRAAAGAVPRRQMGVLLYSEQSRKQASSEEHHYFALIGYDLQDRNRKGEIFFLVGLGLSSAKPSAVRDQ